MEEHASGKNDYKQPLSEKEKAEIKRTIYQDLQLPATSGRIRFFPGGKKSWLPQTVAAAVVLIIAIPLYLVMGRPRQVVRSAAAHTITSIAAGNGEMKKMVLTDGTVVWLNANSTLRYDPKRREDGTREVSLEGNAFFSVAKSAQQEPFLVHAGPTDVTVLGTELNVNARSEATEISLANGKVKIARKGSAQSSVYLQPGEKVRFDPLQSAFVKSGIDARLYEAWTKGQWNFRQTSLEEITGLFREYYGVQTVFLQSSSKRLRINAVLPVNSLEKIVQVIERTLRIQIEVKSNQLIVHSSQNKLL